VPPSPLRNPYKVQGPSPCMGEGPAAEGMSYRGCPGSELRARCSRSLFPMTRSRWKGPFCEVPMQATHTRSRRSTILPQWIGRQLQVYTGHRYVLLQIREEMVGHRLGEFASTRRPARHTRKGKGPRAR
jgi:small subunit ribosomal protein S19